ncbi:MAG TPA: phenylalanine--tRNA ligase subunit beta [archaeon]|jgi:phenylalanyl-tRNA synthetase beta chain|nr:phenylalanine--tRNA ligase subunit beta [archaeon]HPV66192.1 phenylalanine--tRNA ligase subunit beta [archaeon]
MATIELNFSDIKKEFNKDISVEDFEELLFNYGFEIDSYNKATEELRIEVTAERTDVLSKEGLLRVLKVFGGYGKPLNYSAKKPTHSLFIDNSVKAVRPYSVCAIIKNLNLTEDRLKQIIAVQEKLHLTIFRKRTLGALGVYPLDKIEFPITFCARSPKDIKFVPLGEDKEMSGEEILKNTETGKEFAHLLIGKDKYPIFVDNSGKILSMPPIINSDVTGKVTENTKDIFIECSGFNLVRLNQVLNIMCCMFSDFGGELHSIEINLGNAYLEKHMITPNLNEEKRLVTLSNVNSLIGLNLDIDEVCHLLEKMCYKTKKYGKDKIEVSIPPYRTDILHEVDIIDDVARAYGFNNIPLKMPKVFTVGERLKDSIKQDNIIQILVQCGLIEVSPLSLSSKKESFENFNIPYSKDKAIELGYSKDKSLDIVSPWLLPKLLKILTNNQHMSYPQKIFSCEKVVIPDKQKDVKSKTVLHTAIAIANSKVSFTESASILVTLCNTLGYSLELEKKDYPFYISGRSATVIINNKDVGHIGEINPEVLKSFDYNVPVVAFEIDVNDL